MTLVRLKLSKQGKERNSSQFEVPTTKATQFFQSSSHRHSSAVPHNGAHIISNDQDVVERSSVDMNRDVNDNVESSGYKHIRHDLHKKLRNTGNRKYPSRDNSDWPGGDLDDLLEDGSSGKANDRARHKRSLPDQVIFHYCYFITTISL